MKTMKIFLAFMLISSVVTAASGIEDYEKIESPSAATTTENSSWFGSWFGGKTQAPVTTEQSEADVTVKSSTDLESPLDLTAGKTVGSELLKNAQRAETQPPSPKNSPVLLAAAAEEQKPQEITVQNFDEQIQHISNKLIFNQKAHAQSREDQRKTLTALIQARSKLTKDPVPSPFTGQDLRKDRFAAAVIKEAKK